MRCAIKRLLMHTLVSAMCQTENGSMGEFWFFIEVLIGGYWRRHVFAVGAGFHADFQAPRGFNFAQRVMVLFTALTFVGLMEKGGIPRLDPNCRRDVNFGYAIEWFYGIR